MLGKCVQIIEAAKYSALRNPSSLPKVHVAKVVSEFLLDREGDGVSKEHVRIMRSMLKRFSEAFSCSIASVDGMMIKAFLDGLKIDNKVLTGRTKNNCRQVIGQLFRFAKFRKYLSKDHEGIEEIQQYKEASTGIDIYTPAEIAILLNHARGQLLPFIAIGAFAGLRHAEICRLDWKDIRLSTGYIEVTAANAKTASRRLVPISDNLAKWLAPVAKTFGPVCDREDMTKPLLKLAKKKAVRKAGFKWKHNALRHSFISYRVADIKNVQQVALECGNSPAIIFKNYRELVTAEQGKAWFSIQAESGKVVKMAA